MPAASVPLYQELATGLKLRNQRNHMALGTTALRGKRLIGGPSDPPLVVGKITDSQQQQQGAALMLAILPNFAHDLDAHESPSQNQLESPSPVSTFPMPCCTSPSLTELSHAIPCPAEPDLTVPRLYGIAAVQNRELLDGKAPHPNLASTA